MVLLDEISGGCSRLPLQHTVSSAGHVVGRPRPRGCEAWRTGSLLSYAKGNPSSGSPVPCVFEAF